MPRVVTFGRQPTTAPEGNFREVHFPELARLDEGTNEGFINRILSSDGGDSRSLPRTISFQELDTFGHDMAAHAGSIWEVTLDGETGIMSGRGWLADDEVGHKTAFAIASKKLQHNSVDLAEIGSVDFEIEDLPNGDWRVNLTFLEWKFGKTTLVASPAFADAHASLSEDELAAAIGDEGPLIVEAPAHFSGGTSYEIVASMDARPSWDYFHRPEPDTPTPFTVGEPDDAGWVPVWGNIAQWNKQHRDAGGRLRHPPRARDNYANYTKPGVLTDKGMVNTGPITLLGGHVTLQEAAENIENTWADVSITDGKHGPWVCGVVRPHVGADLAKTYAARASQVSGYWPDGQTLRLICSVSAAGYPVTPDADDNEFALAASFAPEIAPLPAALKSFKEMSDDDQATVKEWVNEALTGQESGVVNTIIFNETTEVEVETSDTEAAESEEAGEAATSDEELNQAAAEERARLLAEGGLADLLEEE